MKNTIAVLFVICTVFFAAASATEAISENPAEAYAKAAYDALVNAYDVYAAAPDEAARASAYAVYTAALDEAALAAAHAAYAEYEAIATPRTLDSPGYRKIIEDYAADWAAENDLIARAAAHERNEKANAAYDATYKIYADKAYAEYSARVEAAYNEHNTYKAEAVAGNYYSSAYEQLIDVILDAAISDAQDYLDNALSAAISHANEARNAPSAAADYITTDETAAAADNTNQTQPEKISAPDPVYPPALKAEGWSGTCSIGLYIDEAGNVGKVWVIRSTGKAEADQAAIEAAWASQWEPATQNGVPIAQKISITYEF
ncbi:MAG TPA: energy transducer TonB [bacterium]|nr:energy transducer TonB [bacterium]